MSSGNSNSVIPVPKLQRMSGFERIMRNKTIYDPNVGQPPVVITGWGVLSAPADRARAIADLSELMKSSTRWGSVSDSNGHWTYLGPEGLDWTYHVDQAPAFKNQSDVDAFINEVLNQEVDLDKPLWKAYLGTLPGGKGFCMFRINHAMGDGLAIDSFLRKICTCTDGSKLPESNPALERYLAQNRKPWYMKFVAGLYFGMLYVPIIFRMLWKTSPFYAFETNCPWTNDRRRKKWFGAASVKFIAMPPIDLSVVKDIKNSLSQSDGKKPYTVNDVLYGLTTGAAKRYCEAQGTNMDHGILRSLTAVGFPRSTAGKDSRDDFVNSMAIAPLSMPVKAKTALDRVRQSQKINNELKTTPLSYVTRMITNVMSNLPGCVRHGLATDLYAKHSTVYSNVAGPAAASSIFGQKLETMEGTFSNFVHQVLYISYNGTISATFAYDPALIKDPECLRTSFIAEFEELKKTSKELNDKSRD